MMADRKIGRDGTHDRCILLSVRFEHLSPGEQPRDTTVDFSAPEDVPEMLNKITFF